MKRFASFLLALLLTFTAAGCCYAPGYEGSDFWQMRYTLPPEWIPESTTPAHKSDGDVEETTQLEPITLPEETQKEIDELPKRENEDFVKVTDYIPDIAVEMKYATQDNIAGKQIYAFEDVYLRYGTVVKLMRVQEELREKGLLLKIWDAFRPTSAQSVLWAAYPNALFVANPETGYSSHSRGNTVDITLVNADGVEVEMPSGFDEFTAQADRNYGDCTETAAANAQLLQDLMEKYGFTGLQSEWWHYTDETSYDVETVFDPAVISTWYAECNEYINIRLDADAQSEAIGQIPKDAAFTLLGWSDHFAFVEYEGQRGYVNKDYIRSEK